MVKSRISEIEREDGANGPVVSAGGRSPSTLSTGRGTPPAGGTTSLGPLAPGQR